VNILWKTNQIPCDCLEKTISKCIDQMWLYTVHVCNECLSLTTMCFVTKPYMLLRSWCGNKCMHSISTNNIATGMVCDRRTFNSSKIRFCQIPPKNIIPQNCLRTASSWCIPTPPMPRMSVLAYGGRRPPTHECSKLSFPVQASASANHASGPWKPSLWGRRDDTPGPSGSLAGRPAFRKRGEGWPLFLQ
jgi:hypothetical protein